MGCSEKSSCARKAEEVAGNGNRALKFLCSYGGNIMPRPRDRRLRYVGGENRLVAVNKDTRFAELMKILEGLSSSSVKLKYQLPSEDLDVLVSVTCDEDVRSMIEEYQKYENMITNNNSIKSCPKLRVFLFPANPPLLSPPRSPTQRYIDMINCCVLTPGRRTQGFSLKTNPDCYAFSDRSGSPASTTVPVLSSSSSSPRSTLRSATRVGYRHSLAENAQPIQKQMKRAPSEAMLANPIPPSKMSGSGQYQHQHQNPQLHSHLSQHWQRVRWTPSLGQHPRHDCAQLSRCHSHGHNATATHGVRGRGLHNHQRQHLKRVLSKPNLEQYPQHCCAQTNCYNSHGRNATASHV